MPDPYDPQNERTSPEITPENDKLSAPTPGEDPVLAWLSEDAPNPPAESPKSPFGASDWVEAEVVDELATQKGQPIRHPAPPRPRRKALPIMLFVATCLSTFFVGACAWIPTEYLLECMSANNLMPLRRVVVGHWQDGLIYMGCVLAILLTHEMGHFIATLRYRVPASWPFFLPLPISPIGTLGAVIGMDGNRANRKEIFDIGIAGPLAGLVVALPILWIGVRNLDFTQNSYGVYELDNPLLVRLMLDYLQPAGYKPGQGILHGMLNPYFMAGWVGLLVTGLNMMPVSQLDGGHVIYTLMGKRAHWVARGFMILAIGYIFYSGTHAFLLMVVLIMLVGTDHPPTRDDTVPLGWFRMLLGCCSLFIPLLCFAPKVLTVFVR